MVSINEITATDEEPLEGQIETEIEPDPGQDSIPQGTPDQPQENPMNKVIEVLKRPTGEGEIDDYINHPLNVDKDKGTAQILRGLTGLLGDLKLAVLDILFGTVEKVRKAKRGGE